MSRLCFNFPICGVIQPDKQQDGTVAQIFPSVSEHQTHTAGGQRRAQSNKSALQTRAGQEEHAQR